MKAEERDSLKQETRPFSVLDCSDIVKAEHWRQTVLIEISKKLNIIQNGMLEDLLHHMSLFELGNIHPFILINRCYR